MKIIEMLSDNLPILTSVLSFGFSILVTFITRSETRHKDDIKSTNININGRHVKIEGYDEKEVIDILEKLVGEKSTDKINGIKELSK